MQNLEKLPEARLKARSSILTAKTNTLIPGRQGCKRMAQSILKKSTRQTKKMTSPMIVAGMETTETTSRWPEATGFLD